MNNKVFITGANGSLGLALVEKFSSENFKIFLNIRKNFSNLNKIHKKNKVDIIKGSLTEETIIKSIANKIKKKKIPLLINNAGVYSKKEFKLVTKHEIKQIFEVNFFSNIFLLRELLRLNVNHLTIVNINSIAGKQGSANETIYSASKHAMTGFYESIEKEKGLNKFNFINLFPGAFKSKISNKRPDFHNLTEPSEIADVIYNLSKNYNSLKINNIFIKRKIY